jgi:hypothetical protein
MERIPLPVGENTPVEVGTLVRDITPRGENTLHCGKEYSSYRKYYCGRIQSFKGEYFSEREYFRDRENSCVRKYFCRRKYS